MMPRLLITSDHPVLPMVIGDSVMCLVNRGHYVDALVNCGIPGDYVILVPHGPTRVGTRAITPMSWINGSHLPLYALLRGGLFLYEFEVDDNRVSYNRHVAGEEVLRGVTMLGDASNVILRIMDALLRVYMRTSLIMHSMYIKRTPEEELPLGNMRRIVKGRRRIHVGKGLVVVVESFGGVEEISIVSTLDSLDSFQGLVMTSVRTSRIIHNVALGRVAQSSGILDLFLPYLRN
jgi:hypothetical protein